MLSKNKPHSPHNLSTEWDDMESVDSSMPSFDEGNTPFPKGITPDIFSEAFTKAKLIKTAVEAYTKRQEFIHLNSEHGLVEATRLKTSCNVAWQAYIQCFVDYSAQHSSQDLFDPSVLVNKAQQLFDAYTGKNNTQDFESYFSSALPDERVKCASKSPAFGFRTLSADDIYKFFTPVNRKTRMYSPMSDASTPHSATKISFPEESPIVKLTW